MQLHNTVRNALLWKDDFNLTEGWRPEELKNAERTIISG